MPNRQLIVSGLILGAAVLAGCQRPMPQAAASPPAPAPPARVDPDPVTASLFRELGLTRDTIHESEIATSSGGKTKRIVRLLDRGAKLEGRTRSGYTPLMI